MRRAISCYRTIHDRARPFMPHTQRRRIHLAFDQKTIGQPSGTEAAATLIFAHCLLGSRHSFTPLIRALTKTANNCALHIVMLDARNHGDSAHDSDHSYHAMVADLHDIMINNEWTSGTDKGPVILVGHSMGARAAMAFALHRELEPLVDGLVAIDAAPVSYAHSHHYLISAMDNVQLASLNDLAKRDAYKRAESALTASGIASKSDRAFALANLRPTASIDNSPHYDQSSLSFLSYHWCVNLPLLKAKEHLVHEWPFDIVSDTRLAPFTKPTLFIGGIQSTRLTQPANLAAIPTVFPNHSLTMFDTGHFVFGTHANECAKEILKFVDQLQR